MATIWVPFGISRKIIPKCMENTWKINMENMHGKWKIINPKIDGMKVDEHENGLNIEQSRCQIRFFVFLLNFPKHSFDPPPSLLRGVSWMRHREAPVIVLQSFATSHRCPVALNSATRWVPWLKQSLVKRRNMSWLWRKLSLNPKQW